MHGELRAARAPDGPADEVIWNMSDLAAFRAADSSGHKTTSEESLCRQGTERPSIRYVNTSRYSNASSLVASSVSTTDEPRRQTISARAWFPSPATPRDSEVDSG